MAYFSLISAFNNSIKNLVKQGKEIHVTGISKNIFDLEYVNGSVMLDDLSILRIENSETNILSLTYYAMIALAERYLNGMYSDELMLEYNKEKKFTLDRILSVSKELDKPKEVIASIVFENNTTTLITCKVVVTEKGIYLNESVKPFETFNILEKNMFMDNECISFNELTYETIANLCKSL